MLTKFSERHPIIIGVIIFLVAIALPYATYMIFTCIGILLDILFKTYEQFDMLMMLVGLIAIFPVAAYFYQLVYYNFVSLLQRALPFIAVLCGYAVSAALWIAAMTATGGYKPGMAYAMLCVCNTVFYTVEIAGLGFSRSVARSVIARLPITTNATEQDPSENS